MAKRNLPPQFGPPRGFCPVPIPSPGDFSGFQQFLEQMADSMPSFMGDFEPIDFESMSPEMLEAMSEFVATSERFGHQVNYDHFDRICMSLTQLEKLLALEYTDIDELVAYQNPVLPEFTLDLGADGAICFKQSIMEKAVNMCLAAEGDPLAQFFVDAHMANYLGADTEYIFSIGRFQEEGDNGFRVLPSWKELVFSDYPDAREILLRGYAIIQLVMRNRPNVFTQTGTTELVNRRHPSKRKSGQKRRNVRILRTFHINKHAFNWLFAKKPTISCPCWYVPEYERTLENGTVVSVSAHFRGKERNNPMLRAIILKHLGIKPETQNDVTEVQQPD